MRSTNDASSACFRGSLSLWWARGERDRCGCVCRGPWGTRFRRVLAQYIGPNPQRQEGNRFRLGIEPSGETSGGVADQEVLGQRPEFVERGVDLAARIALDGAGRGRRPPRLDA